MPLKNKVVLLFGGTGGIGAATAELFAKEGAVVTIVGRNETKLHSIAKNCQQLGATTLAIKADITIDNEVDAVVRKTINNFGKLDVLVNSAGISRETGMLTDNFLRTYDEVMNTNMRSVARVTYFALPHLIKTKGNIVNVSSVAGSVVLRPNYIAYRTSKAALNHFTRCVAAEMAHYGVRVNSINPGPVLTDMVDGTDKHDMLKELTALKRISDPYEIANMIVYMASDKAESITGSNYVIDNGTMLR